MACRKMGCRKIRPNAKMPLPEDIFSEDVKELPELGEILSNHHKKARHRRVLVRMLYEYYETKNWRFVWTLQIFI